MSQRFTFRLGRRKGPQAIDNTEYLEAAKLSRRNLRWWSKLKLPKLQFHGFGFGDDSRIGTRPTIRSSVRFLGHIMVLLRNLAAWGVFALISAGLIITMSTAQAPWDIVSGRPPQTGRSALRLWGNEQQQYGPDHIVSIGDDRSLLAMQMTSTSGNTLLINAGGDVSKSASVLFKDYTLFLWADSRSSLWLHRGNKMMQKYDGGELQWQKQFESWPDLAWCSEDGYVLVLFLEGNLKQRLILYAPSGVEMWQYSLQNAVLINAAVSRQGRGVALGVLSFASATPQSYGYLLDPNGNTIKAVSLGESVPRAISINKAGDIAVVGNANSIAMLRNNETEKASLVVDLRNELQTLAISSSGTIVACAMATDANFMQGNNQSEIVLYELCADEESGDESLERLWVYQLQEEILSLAVAGDPSLVFVTTPDWLKAFSLQGAAEWSVMEKELGATVRQVAVAPSGEVFAVMDTKDRLSIWKAPVD